MACSAAAEEHDPELATFLRLAAVAGARRGELCALRSSDLDLEGGEIVISRSLALGTHDVLENVLEKETKTHRSRRIALDAGTIEALGRHRRLAESRAKLCETSLVDGAHVFARDIEGRQPWRPDSGATGRFDRLRKKIRPQGRPPA